MGPFLVDSLSFCVANLHQKGENKGKNDLFFFCDNVKTTCLVLSWRGPLLVCLPLPPDAEVQLNAMLPQANTFGPCGCHGGPFIPIEKSKILVLAIWVGHDPCSTTCPFPWIILVATSKQSWNCDSLITIIGTSKRCKDLCIFVKKKSSTLWMSP